jgi:hypothetical protein
MSTFLRLSRRIAREPSTCLFCGWVSMEFDPVYELIVDGTPIYRSCSSRCADIHLRINRMAKAVIS